MTDGPSVSTFSASGEDAITRTLDFNIDPSTQGIVSSDLVETYEIERTVAAIVEGDFKRVRLFYHTLRTDSS
jgi:diphthamide biosynthesis protein 2